jgi:Protein of unknown function (DUF2034)
MIWTSRSNDEIRKLPSFALFLLSLFFEVRSPIEPERSGINVSTTEVPCMPSQALLSRALSSTAIGTAYELACLSFLQSSFRMSLRRVGQANDGGVDLRGWWDLRAFAPDAHRLRIYAQCKSERRPAGPRILRELEGTLLRRRTAYAGAAPALDSENLPDTWPVVGALCAQSGFSTQALLYFNTSPLPMLLLQILDEHHCSKALFNNSLQRVVGGRLTVECRHSTEKLDQGVRPRDRSVLCWQGSVVGS